ncbi:DUF397 domain-containing protein [Thermobifida alba]|mgnify:CR=1 FL=1|uniref:DUF397 domain-containing protein n=1 Tax=Thermobifida alba TaxID=53522 RepID=A0ABY4L1P4_THEAE|nr:DUF397 domain-containing protein [Thermobifida alba]UPT19967.1 DUF397 domain-containing protein [Thermobifida alba]
MGALEDTWHESSHSGDAGNGVEAAVPWHKSSHSIGVSNCVEVAGTPGSVLVRDTQHRHLGHLDFTAAEWVAFLAGLRNGRL